MSESVKLSSFPTNKHEALAMIYLKSIDLTGKSPEEILRIYEDTLTRIKTEQDKIYSEMKEAKRAKRL